MLAMFNKQNTIKNIRFKFYKIGYVTFTYFHHRRDQPTQLPIQLPPCPLYAFAVWCVATGTTI
jgi:hypothetical protein